MEDRELLFRCFVPGRPIVKKNTQRVIGSGRNRRVIYSSRYRKWMREAATAIRQAANDLSFGLPISTPIEMHIVFWLANKASEPDLSNLIEGPQDMLKSCGIIVDDRLIVKIVASKSFCNEHMTESGVVIMLYHA